MSNSMINNVWEHGRYISYSVFPDEYTSILEGIFKLFGGQLWILCYFILAHSIFLFGLGKPPLKMVSLFATLQSMTNFRTFDQIKHIKNTM